MTSSGCEISTAAETISTLLSGYSQNARSNEKAELENDRAETFNGKTYSWTEHISRKWGQWLADPKEITEVLKKYRFQIDKKESK